MAVIVIAGVSFPCGARELGDVALHHGYDPIFLEHSQNAALVDVESRPVRYEDRLPEDVATHRGMFIPLLESWVSEGRSLADGGGLRFDRHAASVSRSKLVLTRTLAAAGLPVVPRFPVETIEEAIETATVCGFPLVLRTDAGYSSRGILIAGDEDELRACWTYQSNERAGTDYAKMRSVMNSPDDRLLIEPWLPGDEWSVDCVVSPAGTFLIRVCRKATAVMAGRPITMGYRVTESVELWSEMRQSVEQWIRVLFVADAVSFACFDVRRNPNGELVPLDFGSRLGGDGIPLLIRRACMNRNPYAAALDAALAEDKSRMIEVQGGHAIVHALTQKAGRFIGITLNQRGEVIRTKPYGFRLEGQGRRGAVHRVGSVLSHYASEKMFVEACMKSSEWIAVAIG